MTVLARLLNSAIGKRLGNNVPKRAGCLWVWIGSGPVDEPRTETGGRFASGLRSAFVEESGDVVEVGV